MVYCRPVPTDSFTATSCRPLGSAAGVHDHVLSARTVVEHTLASFSVTVTAPPGTPSPSITDGDVGSQPLGPGFVTMSGDRDSASAIAVAAVTVLPAGADANVGAEVM